MLSWLRKKAAQQSLFNVELNARSLIIDANGADAIIHKTGTSRESGWPPSSRDSII